MIKFIIAMDGSIVGIEYKGIIVLFKGGTMRFESKEIHSMYIKLFYELTKEISIKDIAEDGCIFDQICFEVLSKMKIIGD